MLLRVKDAADQMACSESFVYKLIAERRIAFVRLGKGQGGVRISGEAIEAYLQQQTVLPILETVAVEETPVVQPTSRVRDVDLW